MALVVAFPGLPGIRINLNSMTAAQLTLSPLSARLIGVNFSSRPTPHALDAVLCLVQAAWTAQRPSWGLPAKVDPLEGWIVSA